MTAGVVAVTKEAVRTPVPLIVAGPEATLQVGLIATVVPLSHVPVAVYVDVAPSFTDAAPMIVMPLKIGTFTMVTVAEFVRVTPPEV